MRIRIYVYPFDSEVLQLFQKVPVVCPTETWVRQLVGGDLVVTSFT